MLHQLARSAIADLAKQGVTLDAVADFDHLVNLDRLARAAADASNDWKTQRAFFPTVGKSGVTLRRLSIGAQLFLDEHVLPSIDPEDRNTELACIAFVMARSGDVAGALLPYVGNMATFSRDVGSWLKSLSVSWQELDGLVAGLLRAGGDTERLIADLLRQPGANKRDRAEADWPDICGELAREFGRDPAWWFWEAPDALTIEMIDKLAERAERERAAAAAAGEAVAPDPDAAFIRARRALTAYKARIVAEKQGATHA